MLFAIQSWFSSFVIDFLYFMMQSDMKHWPFKVVAGADQRPMIEVEFKGERKTFYAEEISSMVLTNWLCGFRHCQIGLMLYGMPVDVRLCWTHSYVAPLVFARLVADRIGSIRSARAHDSTPSTDRRELMVSTLSHR